MLTVEVIEDDPAMRALLSEWLATAGYRVRSRARLGAGAGTNGDVAAAVVDLMNVADHGADTVRQARRLYAGAAMIGISTQFSETAAGDPVQARALGVDRAVAKPCSRQALLAAVAQAIGLGA